MAIAEQLDHDLKAAMRARDAERTACIRQVRSKAQEAQNAAGFDGNSDDAFYQRIIGSYIKSLEKSMVELERGGPRSAPIIAKYRAEIAYLEPLLPQKLGEAETQALVADAIASLGAKGVGQAGRVMGQVLKAHRDVVDPALAKRLAEQLLAQG